MTTQELRIGNYVKFDSIVEITCISNDGDCYYTEVDQDKWVDEFTDIRHFEPIDLTPDVLEACGFIKNAFHQFIDNRIVKGAYRRYYFKEDIMNAIYQENRYGDEFIAYCRYLHSLQNIYYALLGEELTIDIDKLKNAVK